MRNLHQIIKHLITLAYIWKTKQQVLKKKKNIFDARASFIAMRKEY